MWTSKFFKNWLILPLIRAHLCTLAISGSFNGTWRLPRDAFRYGGLTYGLVLTAALIFVALPVTLLQLAIGQLSQQDTVGVWRAVPFFKGIGFLRILISFLSSAYTFIYVSLSIAYFLYSASNSFPFPDCIELDHYEDGYEIPANASECLSNTFMSAVGTNPEYYLAMAFIIVVLWIAIPFTFYHPSKWMKRVFYVFGPVILILGMITVSFIGDGNFLSTFVFISDWRHFLEPKIWHAAIIQALWSCHIAGGYMISAGDSVYSNTNVQWTSLAVVSTNIISSWFWLLFWFAVSGRDDKDTSVLAVLLQTYQVTMEVDLPLAWPLILYTILIMSGIVGLLALLYPICEFLRRVGGVKWRLATFAISLGGAAVSLAMLAGRLPAITLIDDIAVPTLICTATALEILVFGFVYGWKTLTKDVEFLIESELPKIWIWGWIGSAVLILIYSSWWVTDIFIKVSDWWEPCWEAVTVIGATSIALIVIIICASYTVIRQVQYDFLSKLKSSFQPSRHWGPRDPITHYYWQAGRDDDVGDVNSRANYSRRELGQFSRRVSFITVCESEQTKDDQITSDFKKRSYSDDWMYTLGRKEVLANLYRYVDERKRSKSLDWEVTIKVKSSNIIMLTPKS